ncbi:hypothetical protein RsTz2092_07300 [Deferribacterales bacterium RsTz2092]|nr:hypothetical protein AGMMS49941_04070 [Deferribacterales bacterium]
MRKLLLLTWGVFMVFSVALYAYDDVEPSYAERFGADLPQNRHWNLAISGGTAPNLKYREDSNAVAKHSISNAKVGGSLQVFFNRNFGFEFGLNPVFAEKWTVPAGYHPGHKVKVSGLQTPVLFLARYPVSKYLDVYGGLGLNISSIGIDQRGPNVKHRDTYLGASFAAETGANLYIGHFVLGVQAKYLPVYANADGYDAKIRSSKGVSLAGRVGVAF